MAKIETSWNLANNYVANWAIEHATELVPKVHPAIAAELAQLTSEWVLSDQDMRGLTRKIMEHTFPNNVRFDRERAKKIVVYLSTKVYAYGTAAELEELGYGKALVLPPQCDGCRCYIQPWSPKGDHTQKGIRWLTANDEHICTTPIKTPWGTVNGCKALHNVIISEGPFLGKHIDEIEAMEKSVTKKCPYCAEEIKEVAVVCRYCGKDLIEQKKGIKTGTPEQMLKQAALLQQIGCSTFWIILLIPILIFSIWFVITLLTS